MRLGCEMAKSSDNVVVNPINMFSTVAPIMTFKPLTGVTTLNAELESFEKLANHHCILHGSLCG